MNSFYASLINVIRGIRASVSSAFYPGYTRTYVFGSIISGVYRNWKHDEHPTVLCLGSYQHPNGKNYTHGLNIHYLSPDDYRWLMQNIYLMKRGNQVLNPRYFYQFMKMNRPSLIKAYRMYHTELCSYKTISPGFSSLTVSRCFPVTDARDQYINTLNSMIDEETPRPGYNPVKVSYSQDELNEHIIEVMNSRKVFN